MNKDKENYTIVYYWTRKRLQLDLMEYCILDYIIFLNDYGYTKFINKRVYEKFHISKNTLNKCLLTLIKKQYIFPIQKRDELFRVDMEIKENMKEERKKFVIIFHDKRKEYKINGLQFGFLSMVYSLSKNTKNKTAYAGIDLYKKYLFIKSDENYYATIRKLTDKNLLVKKGISSFQLSDEVFDFFKKDSNNFSFSN